MQVHRNIELLPPLSNAVITIGTFDGVHAGHQQIIAQLKKEAQRVNGETVIITFHPHPRKVVREGQAAVAILTTLAEKIDLLEAKGIDHLVVVPFTGDFASQSAEEFITNFLWEKFRPHTIIIGYDHRFGKDRKGDYHLLEEFGGKLGFAVKEIPEQLLNDIIISSTRIREALLVGDVATANSYLGHAYFFEGTVVDGNKLGRTLGYPTANLRVEDTEKLVPGNGIYAVIVEFPVSGSQFPVSEASEPSKTPVQNDLLTNDSIIPNQSTIANLQYQGMMSIGIRPTIGGTDRVIEVNIFDFAENIYGKTVRVYLKKYLRAEVKFNGLEELTRQLHKDKEDSLVALANT
jgi:riboflavin kinase/FMN adenylyltransferase